MVFFRAEHQQQTLTRNNNIRNRRPPHPNMARRKQRWKRDNYQQAVRGNLWTGQRKYNQNQRYNQQSRNVTFDNESSGKTYKGEGNPK